MTGEAVYGEMGGRRPGYHLLEGEESEIQWVYSR